MSELLPLWSRPGFTPADFPAYLESLEPYAQALSDPEGRRLLTQHDPILFALTYLSDHLRGPDGAITFAECHIDWARQALGWVRKGTEPAAWRRAYIAPRDVGKTTWWFLILPMWAAAQGHAKFAVAFANTAQQAETHLQTFKGELDTNPALNADFPMLCKPMERARRSVTVADNRALLRVETGFTFAARGVDSSALGLKIGRMRPDLIILDDVEPDEASYSPELARKRLGTLRDAILPLNIYARVVLVGTVTMPGSITHRLVQEAKGAPREDGDGRDWIAEEGFTCHHYDAILTDDSGEQRSLWPDKWNLAYLQSISHTRSYRKNYANDPMASDGDYWTEDDFTYTAELPHPQAYTRHGLWIDPTSTTKTRSDPAGLAVLSYAPPIAGMRDGKPYVIHPARVCVRYATQVRLVGRGLRERVEKLLALFPEITVIFIETNTGGEMQVENLQGIPGVKVVGKPAGTESKEVRFADALYWYQRRPWQVAHAERLPILEEQMVKFPKGDHDDVADAVVTGVRYFLRPAKVKRVEAVQYNG